MEIAKLTAQDGKPGDSYGSSVSVSGNDYLMGGIKGSGTHPDSGSAYVFKISKLVADLDGDGDVDWADLLLFIDKWLCPYGNDWPLK